MTGQQKAFKYLVDRGYDDELESQGVMKWQDLKKEHIQSTINDYCAGTLQIITWDDLQSRESVFDTGYDLGVAMTLIKGDA